MNQVHYQVRYALPLWLIALITAWMPDNRISIRIRGFLISLILPGRPSGLTIGRDVTLLGARDLIVGDNVYFAKGVWINALGGVRIGNGVMLAPYVVVVSTKHLFKNGTVHGGGVAYKSVIIGDGSWVAAHSTIVAGVKVGKGCIVAANSVVVKDCEDSIVLSGVPATQIRKGI